MEYIIYRRFKTKAICGDVNLPAGTVCQAHGNMLFYNGKPLCVVTSENAHKHFARNDDGKGMERGGICHKIINRLQNKNGYQERWDKVWEDAICQRYKRQEHADNWLWNHAFYNTSIEDLKHIAKLVGV